MATRSALKKTIVQLNFACSGVPRLDILSSSDPFVVVRARRGRKSTYEVVGQTEVQKNNANPVFSTRVPVQYAFEENVQLMFEVYDSDSDSQKLSKHDLVGSTECTLGFLVKNRTVKNPLQKSGRVLPSSCEITITAVAEAEHKSQVTLLLKARKLDKKDGLGFGSSDPFYTINTKTSSGQRIIHYKSEVIFNNLNPIWKPQTFLMDDASQEAFVMVEDYDERSPPDFIGEARVTLTSIARDQSFEIYNERKRGRNKVAGQIIFEQCLCQPYPSFLEYIQSGYKLQFFVAVDFTASNGNPTDPRSLHYMAPDRPNEYMQALYAVGGIISEYSADNFYPAFGFGGLVPGQRQPSFAFPLNAQPNPHCYGINGIVDAYRHSLHTVKLAAPTNFSPILAEAMRYAQAQDPLSYTAMLILTDGAITDLEATVELLVKASELPLGVIIIGVGNADFKSMERLDSDKQLLRSRSGRVAKRDMVQFVAFQDFKSKSVGALESAVLRELPADFVKFFFSRGRKPLSSGNRSGH